VSTSDLVPDLPHQRDGLRAPQAGGEQVVHDRPVAAGYSRIAFEIVPGWNFQEDGRLAVLELPVQAGVRVRSA